MNGRFSVGIAGAALLVFSFYPEAEAAESVTFSGKTISMMIASEPGGGTDAASRLVGRYIGNYLPGQPKIIIRNNGAGNGIAALNHVVQQTQPDGLTLVGGSSSNVDPLQYRKPGVKYDPAQFKFVGGISLGGSMLLISKQAEPRLTNKNLPPVIVGSPGVTQSGLQVVLWGEKYLGWNVKWVTGYRGANEVTLALERGEADMTSTLNMPLIQRLRALNYVMLNQTGGVENGKFIRRPEFADIPVFSDLMAGKIDDPTALEAFHFWESRNAIEKWIGLAPGTPDDIVEAYREAFRKMSRDPGFLNDGKKISEGLSAQSTEDLEFLIHSAMSASPAAIAFTKALAEGAGIHFE
jgi:tripartite-type tricarboxylate transporter receptor subunit TctC